MPFDGTGSATGEYLQKLDAVIDLLGIPERWGKGGFQTPDGRYCLRGAIRAADGGEVLSPLILDAINEVTGHHYLKIEWFNDDRRTDHRQVLAVLTRARENIAAGRFGTPAKSTMPSTRLRRWWNQVTGWVDLPI